MNPMMDEEEQEGGRRHQKKTRKVNSALKSWVAFVKKVQHEEKISYPDAMKRASKRKSEWKRGGAYVASSAPADPLQVYMGGRRRTRAKRGGNAEVGVTPNPIYKGGAYVASPADVSEGYYERAGGGRRTKRGGCPGGPCRASPAPYVAGGRRTKRGGNALAPAAYVAGKHTDLATHWKQGGRRTRRRR